jgi:hypothetical protein
MTKRLTSAPKLLARCKYPFVLISTLDMLLYYLPVCELLMAIVGLSSFDSCLSFSGYLAPEYAMRGHMTEKVDVFAFGVVALEIVAGESNHQNSVEEDTTYIFERVTYMPS